MFKDRKDAAEKLAKELGAFTHKENILVVGLVRGGLEVAFFLSQELDLPLDFLSVAKIASPLHPELAIGGVSEGVVELNEEYIRLMRIPSNYIEREVARGNNLNKDRNSRYSSFTQKASWKDATILLVDDGLATGYTMLAAIQACKNLGVREVIPIAPVASQEGIDLLKAVVSQVIALHISSQFYAIGQFYENFQPVDDERVLSYLFKSRA